MKTPGIAPGVFLVLRMVDQASISIGFSRFSQID
jgi:hypothetical protein